MTRGGCEREAQERRLAVIRLAREHQLMEMDQIRSLVTAFVEAEVRGEHLGQYYMWPRAGEALDEFADKFLAALDIVDQQLSSNVSLATRKERYGRVPSEPGKNGHARTVEPGGEGWFD